MPSIERRPVIHAMVSDARLFPALHERGAASVDTFAAGVGVFDFGNEGFSCPSLE